MAAHGGNADVSAREDFLTEIFYARAISIPAPLSCGWDESRKRDE
ncbi:MAG: hypothetical protein ABSD59_09215 [Terracidiphilus sp.]|jgi:hypothetical protein